MDRDSVSATADNVADNTTDASSHPPSHPLLRLRRALVWLLLGLVALRYVLVWLDVFAGASLPQVGAVGFTVVFAAFSILHAVDRFGWRRALIFLLSCAAVSFGFEAFGVATGAVFGAYHFSAGFGARVAGVPVLIPFAWFMMCYASWIVAHLLLEGLADPGSALAVVARSVIAAAAMTAWDVVMDPAQARAGSWVWENGGGYFGVPFQNFVGWMANTLIIYLLWGLAFNRRPVRARPAASRLFSGAPVLAYAVVAVDHLLVTPFPELHIVAAFGICFIALLALLRLILGRGEIAFSI